MLNFRGAVALVAFIGLVWQIFVSEFNSSNVAVSILHKNNIARLKILIVSIEDNWKSENESIGKSNIVNNMFISSLIHKSCQGRESTIHDKLNVTELTRAELQFLSALSNGSILFFISFEDKINKSSTVGCLLGSFQLAV